MLTMDFEIVKLFCACNLLSNCYRASDSSVSTERIFSNIGNIHTKVHNQLGSSSAFKLVFCFGILRRTVDLEHCLPGMMNCFPPSNITVVMSQVAFHLLKFIAFINSLLHLLTVYYNVM